MLVHGLEQVAVRLSIDRRGAADVLEIEAPYLTPAAAQEIRAALQECPWAPPAPGEDAREIRLRLRAR